MEVQVQDVFFDHDDPEPDLQRSGAKRKEPGSDGSNIDKLSLDLKFNPRNTAISSRPGEEHYICKTVFTEYDIQEDWCTEQKDVWLDWVTTFGYRPLRCLIIVHPVFSTQRRIELLAKYVHFSRAK